MISKKNQLRRLITLASATLAAPFATAANTTSNWNGLSDLNWQNAGNWSAGVPNNAGTNIFNVQFLGATSPAASSIVDVNGSATIAQLQFGNGNASNATTAFTLGNSQNNLGGALTIVGNTFDSTNSSYVSIVTGTAQSNRVTIASNLTLAPGTLGSNIRLNIQGADLLITGNITQVGSGVGLVKDGGSLVELSGANTYSGVTTIQQNFIYVQSNAPAGAPGALGNATSAIQLGNAETISSNAVGLVTDGSFTIGRDISVNQTAATGAITLGGSSAQTATSTFTGAIGLNSLTAATIQSATTGTNIVDIQGPISGVGGIIKTLAGKLQLDNVNNSFTGSTIVRTGTLLVAGNAPSGANGTLGNGTSAVAVGDIKSAKNAAVAFLTSGNVTVGRSIVVFGGTSSVAATLGADTSQPNVTSYFTGAITLNSTNVTIFQSSATGTNIVDFQGAISGTGAVVKATAGNAQFDNSNNSYTGLTTIRNGALILTADAPTNANGSLGNATTAVALGDISSNNARPALLAGNNITIGRDISVYGGNNIAAVTLGGTTTNITGAKFIGALNLGNGTAAVSVQSYVADPGAIDFAGLISGLSEFDTTGPGVVRLDSPGNTYSGRTVVGSDGLGGTLVVNTANTGGGSYNVLNTAKLTGTGSIVTGSGSNGVEISVGAALAPGLSAATGTFLVTGDATIDGTLAIKLNTATSDLLNDVGVLNLDPTSVLNLSSIATPSASTYILANYSTLNGTFGNVVGLPANYNLNYGFNGNSIALVAVPEPTTLSLLIAAPLMLRRRRR